MAASKRTKRPTETGIQRAIDAMGGVIGLAYHAHVTAATVYTWRRRGGIVRLETRMRVAQLSGVPVAALKQPDTSSALRVA